MSKLVNLTCVVVISAIGIHYYQEYRRTSIMTENAEYYRKRNECRAVKRGELPRNQTNLFNCVLRGFLTLEDIEKFKGK